MKRLFFFFLAAAIFALPFIKNKKEKAMERNCNKLKYEKSPYLLQHKDNPVCWYPWGKEAFEKAKKEDKPIFLSIGYSSCYWCHVMEKDSFEDKEVAEFLNKHFISIKVDREERPDVDSVYMDAVTALTGRGGWPLSVFLTPDLKPFWGGTFFYKKDFLHILHSIAEAWQKKREELVNNAKVLTKAINKEVASASTPSLTLSLFKQAAKERLSYVDWEWGGFGNAPKFPPSVYFNYLLSSSFINNDKEVEKALRITLDKMALGGIFDHLGGGFHRYSTDRYWLVPHFEKMLYDNALLLTVYSKAYLLFKDKFYLAIARETANFLLNTMRTRGGAFISAIDAGDVGKEGEYYTWSYEELRHCLSEEEIKLAEEVYNISTRGNFEGKNILYFKTKEQWARANTEEFLRIKGKLLKCRESKEHPRIDDKVLTNWNSLAISGLLSFYRATGEKNYYLAAKKAAKFILDKSFKKGRLYHRWRENETK
ncbi:MAG: thioredoxin domain-containing protein, partial [Candidatus Dadabacteria bacterium]